MSNSSEQICGAKELCWERQCLHYILKRVSSLTRSFFLLWTECPFAAGAHQMLSWECILPFSFKWKGWISCAPSPLCFVTKTIHSVRRCTSKNTKSKVFSHKQRSVSVLYWLLYLCSFQCLVIFFTLVVSWLHLMYSTKSIVHHKMQLQIDCHCDSCRDVLVHFAA